MESLFPDADPNALDLLENLLSFDPSRRYTAEMVLIFPLLLTSLPILLLAYDQALQHPYFADYHDPEDEVCELNAPLIIAAHRGKSLHFRC